ncbi:MAG TPA: DUF6174 domain-containing protein [Solirubrobacteraceae bacterium]|nr:DUF6174 domain-containing protein [Solirubrobacteraceae bacterium]
MRAVILATLALLAAGACGAAAQVPTSQADPSISDGSAQRALSAARTAWRARGRRSYRFELRRSCYCPQQETVLVVVRKGRIVRHPADLEAQSSVPRLFRTIQSAIDRRVAKLDVTYGARGVPRSIEIDSIAQAVDDEVGYSIRRFTLLK